jgi:hypothetical protein
MLIHTHSTFTLFALYLAFGTLYNHLTLGLFRKYTRRSRARSREEALKLLVL